MRLIPTGRWAARFLTLLCLLLGALPALAQDDLDGLLPVTEAYKLSADASTPGVVKLHWTIAPDYYLYRGRMKFKAADGVTLGEAQLPDGEKHHDEYLGDVETYHHGVDATVPYTVAAGTTTLKLSVQYQGCHEVAPKICYPPHTEQLSLAIPAAGAASAGTGDSLGAALGKLGSTRGGGDGAALPAEQAFHLEALAKDRQHLLLRWTMPKGYYLYRDQTALKLKDAGLSLAKPEWPAGVEHEDAHFGKTTVFFDQVELPVAIQGDTGGLRTVNLEASFQGCQDGGICYPLMTRALAIDLGSAAPTSGTAAEPAPEMPPAHEESLGLALALLFALAGGLILNFMPCVLPVLSIKVVSVIESGESHARRRSHALAYTAGVLVSFVVLGLVVIAVAKAWGAQLQYAPVVAALALIMLTAGLWLSGVVQFGGSLGNVGSSLANQQGWRGDFFVGVLAVVVASPCTGPLMGPALGYAFAAPAAQALLVFFTLGLGLALPFLAIGFVPALARLLPRPGAWMETLKQVLAFPMYLSAAWLAWVLANQRGADAVGVLLVAAVWLAATLWWFEKSRWKSTAVRAWVLVPALLTVLSLYTLARLPVPASGDKAAQVAENTVAFTPARLAELRKAGTPVFVDMTADWCVTCKANEHAVLNTDSFRDLLRKTGAVYMKGDWTNEDPAITAFLQEYHSPGVPLYVVFPKDGGHGQRLPTVLTSSLVEDALTKAAGTPVATNP
ncbi:Thiol:disulfide interchange protein DsbD [Dyella jiangningensis]|uniref:protein-disulfide reductase DsbD family protein n=1 Tax=Dyella sp. AtDHG13 TaxID=1938897 RepID=UPI0008827E32|nr:protein-disulfide reductase DsbD [Dyella sp. AtDHG13]PXV59208.1 thiol:disulfide interchange protein DsbD [Dyella sp. AtDHG13]SDK25935.1 Thiol:disulfide interchange protein DsbD [Dyella jiangningensis]